MDTWEMAPPDSGQKPVMMISILSHSTQSNERGTNLESLTIFHKKINRSCTNEWGPPT